MAKFGIIIIAFVFIIPGFASAEPEYTWYKEILGYTTKGWYTEMAVDKEGELWILNNGRVFNFNGQTWEDYTYEAGGANQISLSLDGVLWFASLDKLIRYDGNQWDYFEMQRFDKTSQVLSSISAAPNNVVWLAVNNRSGYGYNLVKFDNGKFEFFTDGFLNPFLGPLTATKDGGVWVHNNTYGLLDCNDDNCPKGASYFDGNTITHYLKYDTLPGFGVSFMAYSPVNDDLYGLCAGNIVKFSDGKWEILLYGSYKEIMYEGMMINGGDGNIWQGFLGTYYNSYLMCMKKNGQWITYDVSELKAMLFKENPNPFPLSFAVTSNGSVWMSYDSGFLRINSKSLNIITSVKEKPVEITNNLSCYPNPFNSSSTIKYYLDKDSPVTVEIYNSVGQKIRNVLSRNMKSGFNYANWNGMDDNGERVSTGFYTVVVRLSDKLMSRKILFLK